MVIFTTDHFEEIVSEILQIKWAHNLRLRHFDTIQEKTNCLDLSNLTHYRH